MIRLKSFSEQLMTLVMITRIRLQLLLKSFTLEMSSTVSSKTRVMATSSSNFTMFGMVNLSKSSSSNNSSKLQQQTEELVLWNLIEWTWACKFTITWAQSSTESSIGFRTRDSSCSNSSNSSSQLIKPIKGRTKLPLKGKDLRMKKWMKMRNSKYLSEIVMFNW